MKKTPFYLAAAFMFSIFGALIYGDSTQESYRIRGIFQGKKGDEIKIANVYYKNSVGKTNLNPYIDLVDAKIEVPKGNEYFPSLFQKRVTEIKKISLLEALIN